MLEHDNLEEFRDGALYDATNGLGKSELDFFSEVARKTGGPVLDVACGTGRMTIPLAEQGYDMTGVDITPEMLATAKEKAGQHGLAIQWIEADVKQLQLDRKYRMIFTTGNAFQAFLTRETQEGLLQFIHRHLASDGVFAFETRNPVLSRLLKNQNAEEERETKRDKDGKHIIHTWKHRYDPLTQLEHYEQTYKTLEKSGQSKNVKRNRIAIRYVFPQELKTLLHYNGFILEEIYGNFDRRPFEGDSPLMVCICRKKS